MAIAPVDVCELDLRVAFADSSRGAGANEMLRERKRKNRVYCTLMEVDAEIVALLGAVIRQRNGAGR